MQGSREDAIQFERHLNAFRTAAIIQRAALRRGDAIELAWIRTIVWPIGGNNVPMAMAMQLSTRLRGQRLGDAIIANNYDAYLRYFGDKESLERWYSDRLKQYLRYRANLE